MAFTPTLTERTVLGSKLLWMGLITGTVGGETEVRVPLSRVDKIWVGNVSESSPYDPAISASGNLITYGTAPTNGATHWLFVLGID
jgi:hypothetical protein